MKAQLAEIDKHSNTCFHGKAIPPIPIHPSCCCGHVSVCQGECNPMTSCCKHSIVYDHIPAKDGIRSMIESSHAQLRQSACIKMACLKNFSVLIITGLIKSFRTW